MTKVPGAHHEIYDFADLRLNVGERVLERAETGDRLALPDKAFDTLCVLVRNAGKLVVKDELISQVWGETIVEENNLNKAIHAIRRALGEGVGDRKFVETVKKHGYRFIAEVQLVARRSESTETASPEVFEPVPNRATVHDFPLAVAARKGQLELAAHVPIAVPEPKVANQSNNGPVRATPQSAAPDRAKFRTVYLFAAAAIFVVAAIGVLLYRNAAVPDRTGAPTTLAVLPLRPFDANDNYLGLGVADAIIRRISQTGTMTVRPTSAVRRYLNDDTDTMAAARALGVDAVLEGTVLRSGDRLRVSVNLLRVSDGRSLWTDNFDMSSSDAFAIQDKVAQQVARSLQLRLDPVQQERFATSYKPNSNAYEYYLKGVYSLDQRGFNIENKPQHELTIGLFEKAVDADPNFALAHAQLAYSYAWMAIYIDADAQSEWIERAKREISRADELDPRLAETHITRHHILLSAYEGFQLEAATREALLAQQLNPNVGVADVAADFLHLGLEDLFEREMERSLEIDPTGSYSKNVFGVLFQNARRYDDWLTYRQRYFDGQPDIQYLLAKGRVDEARPEIEQRLAKMPDDLWALDFKALFSALKGEHRDAAAAIPAITSRLKIKIREYHHHTYNIACVYALAGNSTEAVKWLRETARTGFPNYLSFERDHFLDRIRQAPEFVGFMSDMKTRNENARLEFASPANN